MSHADRVYLFITAFLLIAAIAGGVMLAVQHNRNQPVDIALSQAEPPELSGHVHIGGSVANHGICPLKEGGTLPMLISDAGVDPMPTSVVSAFMFRGTDSSASRQRGSGGESLWTTRSSFAAE
jgi:hypothetical protein